MATPKKLLDTVADLKKSAHELNYNCMTPEQLAGLDKSLAAYGDLSGIIFNRRTKKQIGGHQRCKLIEEEAEFDVKYLDKKDEQGTVGRGYIITKKYGRQAYREVDWPVEVELAAMVAANAHRGEWDPKTMRELLVLVNEKGGDNLDPDTLGLQPDYLEKLFKAEDLGLNVQETEKKALQQPLNAKEMENLPSQVAMVQLFFTVTSRPDFLLKAEALKACYGKNNITDTVAKAVENEFKRLKKEDKENK